MELLGDIPRHVYCYVERRYLGEKDGLEPCSWFGLISTPNRAWGLVLLLENGAVYQNVPPHAISFVEKDPPEWKLEQSQTWDTFGVRFATHEYAQLAEREVEAYVHGDWLPGTYLFTAQHYSDGYSREPSQTKAFHFIRLENGRLTIQPGNRMLVHDPAFTRVQGKPMWLRTQREVYSVERRVPWDDTITDETG